MCMDDVHTVKICALQMFYICTLSANTCRTIVHILRTMYSEFNKRKQKISRRIKNDYKKKRSFIKYDSI